MAANLLSDKLKRLIGLEVSVFGAHFSATGPLAAVGDDYLLLADAVSAVYVPFASLNFVEVSF
jgi:hypothetical protein